MSVLIPVIILGGIGLAAGILLSIAAIVFAVKEDEKAKAIAEALPGANCGACGYSGCSGYAAALSEGKTTDTGLCAPGGAAASAAISQILGVEAGEFQKKAAVVHCRGTWDLTQMKMEYQGMKTCAAANQLFSGIGACPYGCIGYGDCQAVCEYGAVTVENGLSKIDPVLCKGCGKCAAACPKGLIRITAEQPRAAVLCSNRDKGAKTRKDCTVGCIGCMRCVKACETGAIAVDHFLATVDPEKCTGCGKCAEVCPQKCIEMLK